MQGRLMLLVFLALHTAEAVRLRDGVPQPGGSSRRSTHTQEYGAKPGEGSSRENTVRYLACNRYSPETSP